MALIWFDGFETYNDSNDMVSAMLNSNLFTDVVPAVISFSTPYGRRSSYGVYMYTYSAGAVCTLASNYVSGVFGFGIYTDVIMAATYHAGYPFFALYDGTSVQLRFHVVGTEIHVYNGAGTKLGETSGFGWAPSVWKYFEVKVLINNSTGIVIIRSGESVILNLSSQDTQYSANAYFNKYQITGLYPGVRIGVDDFYFCDLTGAKNNDFLGDVRIDIIRPNAAGTYTNFTPSAGANYQNVDEILGPDDNTTYNDSDTVGHKDTYNMGDLPTPAGTTIHGVKSQITVRKTDAGARKCKLLTIADTTEDLGDEITLSDSFTTHPKIYEDNPDDSAAWEDADVNAVEVGVEITA